MNLWFRLLFTLLVSWWRPRCRVDETIRTPFRVLPTDLDTAMHVNNGVYFSLADLARVDYLIRSRLFGTMRGRRWFPVVASETMQFHRALLPFERFEIETRFAGWDDRSFYILHRFLRRGGKEVSAEAVVRGFMVRKSGGLVPIRELLEAFGTPSDPEPLPPWVVEWARAQDANRQRVKQEAA